MMRLFCPETGTESIERDAVTVGCSSVEMHSAVAKASLSAHRPYRIESFPRTKVTPRHDRRLEQTSREQCSHHRKSMPPSKASEALLLSKGSSTRQSGQEDSLTGERRDNEDSLFATSPHHAWDAQRTRIRQRGSHHVNQYLLPTQSSMSDGQHRKQRYLRQLVGDVGLALFAPLDVVGSSEHEVVGPRPCDAKDQGPMDREVAIHVCEEDCRQDLEEDEDAFMYRVPMLTPASATNIGTSASCSTDVASSPQSSASSQHAELDELDDSSSFYSTSSQHDDSPSFLEPEPWQDLVSCSRILSEQAFSEIRTSLPDSIRMNKWERCFAIGRDGDSMISLLNSCSQYAYTILVIQTTQNHILGGFATECWNVKSNNHRHSNYYGTGQSFLFCTHPDILPGVDEDRDAFNELAIYNWTGMNDYCQICSPEQNRLAMGGEGDFGLIVQDDFSVGETGRSMTFRNPPLVPGGHFEIAALELYGLVPLFASLTPSPPPPVVPASTASSTRSSARSLLFTISSSH